MTTSRNSKLDILLNFLVAALLFVLPTHFFLKWGISDAYVRGLLIDYIIPKLYLSDLLAVAIVALGLFQVRAQLSGFPKPKYLAFGVLTLILIGSQFLSQYPTPAVLMALRICLMVLLGWILIQVCRHLRPTWILSALLITIMFQSSLGLYQFLTQHSLLGYSLLGEPTIPAASGLATASFGGAERVLPYGTTAHPNVLAGVLAIYLTLTLKYWQLIKRSSKLAITIWVTTLILGSLTLYLTHSISGYVTLLLGVMWLIFSKKIPWFKTSLLAGVTLIAVPLVIQVAATQYASHPSLTRRAHLNFNALRLWVREPLIGVGLTNNAAVGENLSAIQETVRFAQPTHHVPLLWLSETGILGSVWLILLMYLIWPYFARKKIKALGWLILIPMASLDHYMLTTEAGLLLVLIITEFWDQPSV